MDQDNPKCLLCWYGHSTQVHTHPLQHQKTFEYVKCAHVSSHGRFWELSRQQWICNFSNYFKFMVCLLWKCLPCQLRNSNFITIHVPLLPQVWKLKKHFEAFENRFLTPFSIHIWPKSSFCHNMQTHHLINAEAFAKMKDDVVLVNTRWLIFPTVSFLSKHKLSSIASRGEIVHLPSLIKALEAKKMWGVALDVFEGEKKWGCPSFRMIY